MEELRHFIQSKVSLDEKSVSEVCHMFKPLALPKSRHLLKSGQFSHSYYYLKKGALRFYFESQSKESTTWFAFENDFFADLTSIKSGQPSQYNVQALEACELYYIDSNDMEQLYERYPKMERFGRLVWEQAFVDAVSGIILFQNLTGKERYLWALENPNLMQRVPLKYLASFLGVTQSSLSRLRAEITSK